MVDLYLLNGIPADPRLPVRIHPLRIVINFSCFVDSSHMVFALPPKSKAQECFFDVIESLAFLHLLLRDRILVIIIVWREHIMYAMHNCICDVT